MKTVRCPACGDKGVVFVRVVEANPYNPHVRRRPHGPCGACGWCAGPAVARSNWFAPEHLPRPRDMGDEEFAFRANLFVLWKTRPASEFLSQLPFFADWLGDRGSAEELAARAEWKAYASKKHDPKGWYQWTVPVGSGWVSVERVGEWEEPYPEFVTRSYIDYGRAKLTRSMHNGRWFLCWPPGFVRVTAPLHHDVTRWFVRISANRCTAATSSKPVERVWPGGYTQLLAPFAAPRLDVRDGLVRDREDDLGLFAQGEG